MAACLSAVMLVAVTTSGHASMEISSKPTQNVNCSGGKCRATARSAVLNVTDLENLLSGSDVELQSGKKAKDIVVKAQFFWASASRLTLDAYRSAEVGQTISVTGEGGLTVVTNDGGSGGDFWFGKDGNVDFWSLTDNLNINGTDFVLVSSVTSLASAIASNPDVNVALAADYDAKADGTYAAPPISTSFGGVVEGLGNSISNLAITDLSPGQFVGLFAQPNGTIRNLNLLKVNIQGGDGGGGIEYVGALAGNMFATIVSHCRVTGRIAGGQGAEVGGFAGNLNGTVSDSSFAGSVSGGNASFVGGIEGIGAWILNSSSSGTIKAGDDSQVGGLAGQNESPIVSSSSSAAVSGGNAVSDGTLAGGLVGYAQNAITSSHATGNVRVGDGGRAGGLVGIATDEIANSSASGTVVGRNSSYVGGLMGSGGRGVDGSFAIGSVAAGKNSKVGGFIGGGTGLLNNVYALGTVHGGAGSSVGGFAGLNVSAVTGAYSIGAATGGANPGGFAGSSIGSFSDSYWDSTTSGTNTGVGSGDSSGLANLTDAQLKSALPAGFDPAVWGQSVSVNNGYPYLLANPPPE